jgi:hypothetical protein
MDDLGELTDITKTEPWHDDTADWERRVEALRVARQIDLMARDVSQPHVPTYSYDDAERELLDMAMPHRPDGDKDRIQDFYIKELQEGQSRMNGALFGANGDGGAIRRLEEGNDRNFVAIKLIGDELSLIRTELAKRDVILEQHEKNIDNIAAMARDNKSREGRVWQKAKDAAIPLIMLGLFYLLASGAHEWLNSVLE